MQNTETAIGLMKAVLENVSLGLRTLRLSLTTTARAPAEPFFAGQGPTHFLLYCRGNPLGQSDDLHCRAGLTCRVFKARSRKRLLRPRGSTVLPAAHKHSLLYPGLCV